MRTRSRALLLTATFGLLWALAACGDRQQEDAGTYRSGTLDAATAISGSTPEPAASPASAVR